jgi:hypothetical protein
MTTAALREYTLKNLAQMAKKRGILGWHSMRKSDLIRALLRDEKQGTKGTARSSGSKTVSAVRQRAGERGGHEAVRAVEGNGRRAHAAQGVSRNGSSAGTAKRTPVATRPQVSAVARKIQKAHRLEEQFKDLSGPPTPLPQPALRAKLDTFQDDVKSPVGESGKDRVVLMVRDPYWLHVHWELSSRSIQRAQAAMAEYWHTARPVIRLLEVAGKGTTSTTETFLRDIVIHGGVQNWYIDVIDPPKAYRVEIGYVASNGRFHGLARSNSVATPEPGSHKALDRTWVDVAENCERIFALSGGYSSENATDELQEVLEERLRRPVGLPAATRYGVGADPSLEKDNGFRLDVDAEMIVFGTTRPGAHVTLSGEPIKLREDGSFTVRMSLPDRRQVLPVTSSSSDGMTQQTVVLAVERNTKVMEAVLRDASQ